MEHRFGEGTVVGAGVFGQTTSHTLFERLENPLPGWQTRKLKHIFSSDRPAFWRVELMCDKTAASVQTEDEDLHAAWTRAIAQADMHNKELFS